MEGKRMVHVATASGTFHARVITARLGAAGILSEARGANEGPYPFQACVEILVPEDEAEEAAALLRADAEAEAAGPTGPSSGARSRWGSLSRRRGR